MAIDFSKPATTDLYATGFVPNLQGNQIGLAQWLDSAQTAVNGAAPTYAKRYNRTSSAIEEFNGSAWAPIALHGINYGSGNLGVGAAPSTLSNIGPSLQVRGLSSALAGHMVAVDSAADGWVGLYSGVTASDNPSVVWNNTGALRFGISTGIGVTGYSELMRLTGGGRLGIGRVPTAGLLEVAGNAGLVVPNSANDINYGLTITSVAAMQMGFNNSGSTNAFGAPSGTMYMGGAQGVPLVFTTAAAERMRINVAGGVGIGGTAAAGNALHVVGNSQIDNGNLTFGGTGAPSASGPSMYRVGPADQLAIAVNGTERMRLDASGNVGFGGAASGAKVEIFLANSAFPPATAAMRLNNSGTQTALDLYAASVLAGRVRSDSGGNLNLVPTGTGSIVFWGGGDSGTGQNRMNLSAAGLLAMQAGNTSGGVQLPNALNSSGTVMDWYEEGSFTPTVTGTTSAGAPGAYSVQTGRFVRFGRMVFIHIEVGWTTHSGTGNTQINGLPYAAAFSQKPLRAVPNLTGLTNDAWRGQTTAGSTTLLLYGNNQNSGANSTRSIAANDIWEIDGWYEV